MGSDEVLFGDTEGGYPPLETVVAAAWRAGQGIDLSGISYGRPHWQGAAPSEPYSYYRFLAGFVRHQKAARIVEIGAHHGGSTMAMCRGLSSDHAAHLVSIDTEHDNMAELVKDRRVQCVRGDGRDPGIIAHVAAEFRYLPIDLLYVDADHRFEPTIKLIAVYSMLLRPQYVLLDDINLNDSMRDMWRVLVACHPGEALNAADVEPAVGAFVPTPRQGFGVIRLR